MSKKHPHKHTTVKKPKPNHFWAMFFFCIILCAYWIGRLYINAYREPTIGQIDQLLWLPMVICTSCMPVYLFVHLNKEHFKMASIYWIPVVLLIATGIAVLIIK